MTTALLLCGVVGTGAFVVTFLVDGATRPGYSPARLPVSALALGVRGWVQTANFVVCGTLVAASALGLAEATGEVWFPLVVAVTGIGLVLSGVFPMDPCRAYPPGAPDGDPAALSRSHEIHDRLGGLVFVSFAVAPAVAALTLDDLGWRLYSAASAVTSLALLGWFVAGWERESPTNGLVQRAAIVVGLGWVGLTCIYVAG